MKCSLREGCSPPAPKSTVTSNHCPRLTEFGAVIFGVCFASMELRCCLNSGSELLFLSTPRAFNYFLGDDRGQRESERHGSPPCPWCMNSSHMYFLRDWIAQAVMPRASRARH